MEYLPNEGKAELPLKQMGVAADNLQLLANALKSARTLGQLKGILMGLNTAIQLINLSAYKMQKKVIESAAFDYDPTESELRL